MKIEHRLSTELTLFFENVSTSDQKAVQAGNKHVFEACMDHLDGMLTFDQKMILTDYHLCYQNALQNARAGVSDASKMWLDKAEELPDFENKTLQRLVDANKHPAIAYHVYRNGEYNKAVKLLQDTVYTSGELVDKDGIDYMVWGQMEEYVNIFRVYCTQKDINNALKYAQGILLALALGDNTKGVVDGVSPTLLNKGEINFLSYATSDVIYRLLKFEQLSLREIIKTVFHPLWSANDWSKCPLKGYSNVVLALKYWIQEDRTKFLQECTNAIPYLSKQSNFLQFCFLEALKPSLHLYVNDRESETLVERIKQYYTDYLYLDNRFLAKHSQLDFTTV